MIPNKIVFIGLLFIFLWADGCPNEFIEIDESCYYKNHIDVLQDFIDVNESLRNFEPQNIGTQEWKGGKLTYLYLGDHLLKVLPNSIGLLSNLQYMDLRKNQLMTIPNGICSLYPYHTGINLTENNICPPYPNCFEYISHQNTINCESFQCPDGYVELESECYSEKHINVLQSIIDNNESLNGLRPLNLGQEVGNQQWENGKLIILDLKNNELTNIPEELCSIYHELNSFDVSNNAIHLPYPSCFEFLGYQDTLNYNRPSSCSSAYISIDEMCYSKKDIQVLKEFAKLNTEIIDYKPLELGDQIWEDNRLNQLYLEGLEISTVPESIQDLDSLKSLSLSNNNLQILPETLCNIYPNLIWIDLANNHLCPPYISCFDYIGQQVSENCQYDFCPLDYKEIDEECYFKKDLTVLQEIIDKNVNLSGREPLEIGVQKWKNMHLDFLYLGVNELTVIPESICEIYTNLTAINISRNKICPPYPECIIEILGEQDTSHCP
tara:strand:+ start:72 stop:1553 length:1482 start_codon:yes stop_codon:yes gene_type:complete